MPSLYAWKSVKWVRAIEYLTADRRGFWEERGYHNTADPWREQRYSYQEQDGAGPPLVWAGGQKPEADDQADRGPGRRLPGRARSRDLLPRPCMTWTWNPAAFSSDVAWSTLCRSHRAPAAQAALRDVDGHDLAGREGRARGGGLAGDRAAGWLLLARRPVDLVAALRGAVWAAAIWAPTKFGSGGRS